MARDAEDFALFQATLLARGLPNIYCDCAGTVGVAQAGAPAGADSRNHRAHLWAKVWAMVETLQVIKTKAHATDEELDAGVTTVWERAGNQWAYHHAKQGAALHPMPQRALDQLAGLRALQASMLKWVAVQEADMQHMELKDYGEFDFNDRPSSVRPWRDPDIFEKCLHHWIGHSEALAQDFYPDDCRGHELWSARILGASHREGDEVLDRAVVMCSRCGCYAHARVQEFSFTCRGPSVMSGTRLARWTRFRSGRFPKHGCELELDGMTRCTITAYAYLSRAWLRRSPGVLEPGLVPDSGVGDYGSEQRRAAIVRTTGATLEEAEQIGASARQAKEHAKAFKSCKRTRDSQAQGASDSD